MGAYSVPEEIRKLKPDGTIVKRIGNGYYVYPFKRVKGEDGLSKVVSGTSIGSIKEGIGFIPNKNYCADDINKILNYGEYELAYVLTSSELDALKAEFNPLEAVQIYLMAIMHAVNGYVPLKRMNEYFNQSYLSLKYPTISFTEYTLSKLIKAIGRTQTRALSYQQSLLNESERIAIDGHCIESYSSSNEMAQYGNKYSATGEKQMNLVMAYDIESGMPILSKMYEGNILDKVAVNSFLSSFTFNNKLFIVDRGFYSEPNLKLLSSNGNNYIIPLSENLEDYKNVIDKLDYKDSFIYDAKRKTHTIFYKEFKSLDEKARVIVYRDMTRSAEEDHHYRKMIGTSKNYTEEKYNEQKSKFGLFVLRTSLEETITPEVAFKHYKKRWNIETFYDSIKNDKDFKALNLEDFYICEGMAFIILVAGRIEERIRKTIREVAKGDSYFDVMLKASAVKVHLQGGEWNCGVTTKKTVEYLSQFGCHPVGVLAL